MNYLLFHSLTEISAATISFATFLFTWNTRRYQNSYLRVVGVASLFVGLFEVLHCLAFPGMSVFPGQDTLNLSPDLWLCARAFQVASVAVGLALLRRSLSPPWLLAGGAVAFALTCAAAFLGYIPRTVPEGAPGLTTFKVAVEWTLASTMLLSLVLLTRTRQRFSHRVFRYLVANALLLAATEICFTLYSRPYDAINFVGHLLLISAVYCQYKAILETGLNDPNEAQFRELVLAREESERVKAHLADANRRLREDDARKNDFLAMLSHELRNPLAPIKTALYILQNPRTQAQQSKSAMEVIGRQVTHMTRLIEDLLDVTRISRGKISLNRERLDVVALLQRVADDHKALFAEKAIEFSALLPTEEMFVNADATRVAQAVGNLLHNAGKFTPAGGHVVLGAERSGERVAISVVDDGAGIPPDVLARIFDAFMQADRSIERKSGGLGLGLALVKGLTELQDGVVRAHSDGVGKGSRFTIELPLVRTDTPVQLA